MTRMFLYTIKYINLQKKNYKYDKSYTRRNKLLNVSDDKIIVSWDKKQIRKQQPFLYGK